MLTQDQVESVSTPNEAPISPEVAPPAPETPANPPPEAPAPSGLDAIAKEPKAPELDANGIEIPEKPAFSPKEKFKAWREEHEVPKWVRDLIKDPETESKAIQLLEKATGLDLMKPKFEETKTELQNVRGQHDFLNKSIGELREIYQRGDIDLWLQKLAIPQERMLQWALDKVNYSQLPPDQQRILDQKSDAERKAWTLEKQSGEYERQVREQQSATIAVQLDSGLARPDVQTFVEAFDAKAGKPGSFRQEVIFAGESEYNRSQGKVTLTPDQAIEAVLQKYKNFVSLPEAQAQSAQAPAAPKVVMPSQAPSTIPNVQGKSTSPMKTGPRSIDDLRKLQKEAAARA